MLADNIILCNRIKIPGMNSDLQRIFAENLSRLLDIRGEDTVSLAKRASINQKTCSNLKYPDKANPELKTIEKAAKGLSTEPWALLIDGFPFERALTSDVKQLLKIALEANPDAVREIIKYAEMRSKFD